MFSLCTALFAHIPNAYRLEQKHLVNVPVLSLHRSCSDTAKRETEAIYGQQITIIEKRDDGWALLETEDGYRAYGQLKNVIADDVRYRTSRRLCRVKQTGGMVFKEADTEYTACMRLPFDARVEIYPGYGASTDRWVRVRLIDGQDGWMQRGDLFRFKPLPIKNLPVLARRFLGLPYIWGGNSSVGYDCSGFIQTLFKQAGILLPRDSNPQAASNRLYTVDHPQHGDVVFLNTGGKRISHVGLHIDEKRYIHAGNPTLQISTTDEIGYTPVVYKRCKTPCFETMQEFVDNMCTIHLTHWGFDGCVHEGQITVDADLADEVTTLFRELFVDRYPIEKMLNLDKYASIDAAMEDNNTFASTPRSIRLNPVLNPQICQETVIPKNSQPFLDRTLDCHGLIIPGDRCYVRFIEAGWTLENNHFHAP